MSSARHHVGIVASKMRKRESGMDKRQRDAGGIRSCPFCRLDLGKTTKQEVQGTERDEIGMNLSLW